MKLLKTLFILIVVSVTTAFTVSSASGYKVGDTIEDFSLKNTDGKMVSLCDFENAKGFIIIFTCNTCPYSIAAEDRIIALDKKYKSKGYPVIAINPNDPAARAGDAPEEMVIRANEKGFTFPYLFDDGQKIYPKFGAAKTPHVYIVSKPNMKVEYIGAIDNSTRNPDNVTERYAEDAVDALLAGKKPETTETRAIGCSIKTL